MHHLCDRLVIQKCIDLVAGQCRDEIAFSFIIEILAVRKILKCKLFQARARSDAEALPLEVGISDRSLHLRFSGGCRLSVPDAQCNRQDNACHEQKDHCDYDQIRFFQFLHPAFLCIKTV